jgi:glyoxylase-like metal-dependent hydrolase (beta-lactamase superfamily II)
MANTRSAAFVVLGLVAGAALIAQEGPMHVDITWMSMANLHYQIGNVGVVTDGYISRIPEEAFFGGPSGLASSRRAYRPDIDAVSDVLVALGGPPRVTLLLTGHSHWDHSFDTATWSGLTQAPIIGSRTTCFQVQAEDIPADRCTVVDGTEAIALSPGVTMYVVRWNHSGDSDRNPEQHNPVELDGMPTLDAASGGLRPGVAEDFPNGGGSRGFLFVVEGPGGSFSWFQQSSASAVDLDMPIVVDCVDHGAPIENLRAALEQAGLDRVDLWIGTGGLGVARLVVPVIRPKAYLPIHWDGLWDPFEDGLARPFAGGALEAYLREVAIELVAPGQFMDQWRLDATGIQSRNNQAVQQSLGLAVGQ